MEECLHMTKILLLYQVSDHEMQYVHWVFIASLTSVGAMVGITEKEEKEEEGILTY